MANYIVTANVLDINTQKVIGSSMTSVGGATNPKELFTCVSKEEERAKTLHMNENVALIDIRVIKI